LTASQPTGVPAPKKGSGCLIAVAVAGGIVVLFVIVIVVAVVHFLGTKEGKNLASIVGEGAKIALQAQSAPGAREVRKVGCAQAAVMDTDAWVRLARLGDQDASEPGKPPASVLVSCTGNLLRTPPTCDDVSKAYLAAVPPPPGRVLVQVLAPGDRRPRCSNLYEADGTFVEALEMKEH
jgi:hypothetical protein